MRGEVVEFKNSDVLRCMSSGDVGSLAQILPSLYRVSPALLSFHSSSSV